MLYTIKRIKLKTKIDSTDNNIIRIMSFTIKTPEGDPIVIETIRLSGAIEVLWKSMVREVSCRGSVSQDNTKLIRSFSIGRLHGIQLEIKEELVELIYEEIDHSETLDTYGDPVKFDIAGPTGRRRLYVTWMPHHGYTRVTSTAVNDNVTTANCKYIKILSKSQDYPHGV